MMFSFAKVVPVIKGCGCRRGRRWANEVLQARRGEQKDDVMGSKTLVRSGQQGRKVSDVVVACARARGRRAGKVGW